MSSALQQPLFPKYQLSFTIRPTLRLSRVEEILKTHRVMDPLPSRRNLIDLLEEGVLEGTLSRYGWLVYEESFLAWLRALNNPPGRPTE
jgi:hypothetical protein